MLQASLLGSGVSQQSLAFLGLSMYCSIIVSVFSGVLSLCLPMAVFLWGHQQYWIKGPPCSDMTSPELIMPATTLFPNKVPFWGAGGWDFSIQQSPLRGDSAYHDFSDLRSIAVWKQMILLLTISSSRRSAVCNAVSVLVSFSSLHLIRETFCHLTLSQGWTQYNREKPHSHKFYYTILLQLFYIIIIAVNLLLCIIYK